MPINLLPYLKRKNLIDLHNNFFFFLIEKTTIFNGQIELSNTSDYPPGCEF